MRRPVVRSPTRSSAEQPGASAQWDRGLPVAWSAVLAVIRAIRRRLATAMTGCFGWRTSGTDDAQASEW